MLIIRVFKSLSISTMLAVVALAGLAEPPQDGEVSVLRIAVPYSLTAEDPHRATRDSDLSLLGNVYQPLVEIDAEGKLTPALAESWQRSDSSTWVFRLSKEARFSDGSPVEARDVEQSFACLSSRPGARLRHLQDAISSIRAVDSKTVRVSTGRPRPELPRLLVDLQIVSRHQAGHGGLGSGPYQLVDRSDGLLRFHRVRTETRSGGFDQVEIFEGMDARQRADALLRGTVDIAIWVGYEHQSEIESHGALWIESVPGTVVNYLVANSETGPLARPESRRRLSAAIDRQRLVDEVYRGLGIAATQLSTPLSFGFDFDLDPADLDRRRADLVAPPVGQEDRQIVLLSPDGARSPALIAESLEAAGWPVKVEYADSASFSARILEGDYGLVLRQSYNNSMDSGIFFEKLVEEGTLDAPEISSLVGEAGRTMDPERRAEILRKVSRTVNEDSKVIPLVWMMDLYGLKKTIEWRPRPDGRLFYSEIRRF